MTSLNLGILAHVDAGKTSLTERLLYAAGVIDEIGSVDAGSTQTDSLALERQRGITIKSAVVSFAVGDVTVNLIDTPGHPDFIAEVERVLERARRRRAGGLRRRGRAGADPGADADAAPAAHPHAALREQDRPRGGAQDERVLRSIARQADPGRRRRWASVTRPRHPRRRATALRTADRLHDPAGRAARRARRRAAGRVRRRTRRRPVRHGCAASSPRRPGGRWCTRCSSARRSPARASTR